MNNQISIQFKNPFDAFEQAIKNGHLSIDDRDSNFHGLYMYMGTENGLDLFKNINTREYIKVKAD